MGCLAPPDEARAAGRRATRPLLDSVPALVLPVPLLAMTFPVVFRPTKAANGSVGIVEFVRMAPSVWLITVVGRQFRLWDGASRLLVVRSSPPNSYSINCKRHTKNSIMFHVVSVV